MEKRILQWMERIDKVSEAITTLCSGLDLEALNRKPSGSGWSAAQILDHIMTINQSYFPMLDQVILDEYQLPFHGRIPILRRFFGRFILRSVQPDRQKKMKTFPVWEPSHQDLPADMVDRFRTHQSKLKSRIEDSVPLLEKEVAIHSPASKMIVYSLSDAFEIIVTHEERHLEQVKEVLS